MDITREDIESLGDKLASLDLTDGEWEALRTVVAMATFDPDDEVSGFAHTSTQKPSFKADFGSLGLKLGPPSSDILAEIDRRA